jgi:hypothetical protein
MAIQSNFPAIKPTLLLDFANTKQLDPRVTFTRASTGTFYGTQTAKAEENLFLYSQEFDNAAWTKSESTVAANNQTAPDGTSTAETMTENTSNALHRVFAQLTSTAITYTASCFFKAGTRNWAYIRMLDSGGAGRNAFFNLSSGVLGTVDSGMSATITSVGNGWYRCSTVLTAAIAGTNTISLGMSSADNTISYTGDGTSTLFLWGAQVEQRSAVTAYTVTTTQPITNYIPVLQTAASGVARFEHNPITFESLGLEIEEQRTNLVLRSEEFDNAAWTKANVTATANTIVAPDGTLTGDKASANTGSSLKALVTATNVTITAGAIYTLSFYVKNSGVQYVSLTLDDGATANGVTTSFDLIAGTISRAALTYGTGASASSSIVAVGNGWYRLTLTGTAGTAATTARCGLAIQTTGITQFISYTGNGFDGVFVWGAQLEAGAFPTSYIQTVASQVTRAADAASMTGTNFSSWYNAAEGTLYVAGRATPSVAQRFAGINDGTDNNAIRLVYRGANTGGFSVNASGTAQADLFTGGALANILTMQAGAYKVNDFAASVNGLAVATDVSGLIPSGVNKLDIGQSSGAPLNGTISKIAYYPLRVTNGNLQALTS